MKQLTNNEIKNISGGLDKTYTCTFTHTSMVCKDSECTPVIDDTITTTLNVKTSAEIIEQNKDIEASVAKVFERVGQVSQGYYLVSCS